MNWIDDILGNGGFETGSFPPWTTSTGAGNLLEVNPASKRSGNYGCDFRYDGAGNRSYIINNTPTAEKIYTRLYFYLDAYFHQTNTSEWNRLNRHRKGYSLRYDINLQRNADGDMRLGVYYYDGAAWHKTWNAYGTVTKSAWHCIQVEYRSNSADGGVRWWFDGVLVATDFGCDLTALTGALNSLMLGYGVYTTDACHLYIDAIVISSTYIPDIPPPIPPPEYPPAEKKRYPPLELDCIATEINGPLGEHKYYYSRRDKRQYRRLKPRKRTRKVTSIRQLACIKHWEIADEQYQQMPAANRQEWHDAVKCPGKSGYDMFMSQCMNTMHKYDSYGLGNIAALEASAGTLQPNASGAFRTRCHAAGRKPRGYPPPIPEVRRTVWQFFEPSPMPWHPGGMWHLEWAYGHGYIYHPGYIKFFCKEEGDAEWGEPWEYVAGCSKNWVEWGHVFKIGEWDYKLEWWREGEDAPYDTYTGTTERAWIRKYYIDYHGPDLVWGWTAKVGDAEWEWYHIGWMWLEHWGAYHPGTMSLNYHSDIPHMQLPDSSDVNTINYAGHALELFYPPIRMDISWKWTPTSDAPPISGEVTIIYNTEPPAFPNPCVTPSKCPWRVHSFIYWVDTYTQKISISWRWPNSKAYEPGRVSLYFITTAPPYTSHSAWLDTAVHNEYSFQMVVPFMWVGGRDWKVIATFYYPNMEQRCVKEVFINDTLVYWWERW